MTDSRSKDDCPECGCDEWTGYCGHFDCHACGWLRQEKGMILRYYEKQSYLRAEQEESLEIEGQ